MIQFNPLLTLDSTVVWIMIIGVILVFSLHLYLQRLIRKQLRPAPLSAIGPSAAGTVKIVAGDRSTNVKR